MMTKNALKIKIKILSKTASTTLKNEVLQNSKFCVFM